MKSLSVSFCRSSCIKNWQRNPKWENGYETQRQKLFCKTEENFRAESSEEREIFFSGDWAETKKFWTVIEDSLSSESCSRCELEASDFWPLESSFFPCSFQFPRHLFPLPFVMVNTNVVSFAINSKRHEWNTQNAKKPGEKRMNCFPISQGEVLRQQWKQHQLLLREKLSMRHNEPHFNKVEMKHNDEVSPAAEIKQAFTSNEWKFPFEINAT